jgi:Arc/MetJ-type ribon-helix-helix transcriptional regulator
VTDVIPVLGNQGGARMETGERISLRLEKDNLELIDQFLLENPTFGNRSKLCREAVQAFIEIVTKGGNTVTVRMPRHYLELIDHLVADGYYLNREHAIVRAVEEHFSKDRLKNVDEHRTEMKNMTGKMISVKLDDKDEVIPP